MRWVAVAGLCVGLGFQAKMGAALLSQWLAVAPERFPDHRFVVIDPNDADTTYFFQVGTTSIPIALDNVFLMDTHGKR